MRRTSASADRLLAVDHRGDLLGDRHLDADLAGERDDGTRRLHALGDHVHLGDDLVERAALAELLADVAVAALAAHAGGDQVAHAGEAGERQRLAAERDAEPRELVEARGS